MAEAFELGDEPSGRAFGVAAVKIVAAGFAVPAETILPQIDLFGDVPAVLDRSVQRLLDVFGEADGHGEDLLASIAEIGPRTSTHLSEFTRLLIEGGADVSLTWDAPEAHRETILTRATATAFDAILRSVEEQERTVIVEGRIVGGSLVRRRFELELPDETILSGGVTEEVTPSLEAFFGKGCSATVLIRETSLKSGETREAYTLVGLAE